jgi:hypothetical protein
MAAEHTMLGSRPVNARRLPALLLLLDVRVLWAGALADAHLVARTPSPGVPDRAAPP